MVLLERFLEALKIFRLSFIALVSDFHALLDYWPSFLVKSTMVSNLPLCSSVTLKVLHLTWSLLLLLFDVTNLALKLYLYCEY